jgi:hypothetical protein
MIKMDGHTSEIIDRSPPEERGAYSFTQIGDERYHVYQEAAIGTKTAACSTCYADLKASKVPRLSLADNCDYGDPIGAGLPPLTLLEEVLISPVIPNIVMLKCSRVGSMFGTEQKFLHGHAVCVLGDGPQAVLKSVPDPLAVARYVKVIFVGADSAYAQWKQCNMIPGILQANIDTVLRHLYFHKRHNPR